MGRGKSKAGGSIRVRQPTGQNGNQNNPPPEDYKTFEDTASGPFTYHGDGQEAVDFFTDNSNVDSLISQMDAIEKDAFDDWTRGHFMDGQQYRGWDGMNVRDQQRTEIFDKYLDQATLEKGVTLARRSDAQLVLGAGKKPPRWTNYRRPKVATLHQRAVCRSGPQKKVC